jgi:hypothetical protein
MLVLFTNVYNQIHNSYKCVCWFFRLVLDPRNSKRKVGSISALFIFICINPLNAS